MRVNLVPALLATLVAFALAGAGTPLAAALARRLRLLDIPNHRSLHRVATPRIGGVVLVLGVVAGWMALQVVGVRLEARVVGGAALVIALLGLVDDLRPLPSLTRLLIQAIVAAAVVTTLPHPSPSWLPLAAPAASALTIVWLIAVTNAYNFMDGIDGIAGLQATIAGLAWLVVGHLMGWMEAAFVGGLVAASAAGFLIHNWQPAKVFMGDAGSGFLGFIFAAMPLMAPTRDMVAPGVAMLVLSPFLVDTAVTLFRRASRGENVFVAHRSHVYQQAVQAGLSHALVARIYGGLAMLGAFAAIALVLGHRVVAGLLAAALLSAWTAFWWNAVHRRASATGAGG